jgi:hypothetical protein
MIIVYADANTSAKTSAKTAAKARFVLAAINRN